MEADAVRIALRPGDGLLIPVGFERVGQPSQVTDYLWPQTVAISWDARQGRHDRLMPVRQPDVGAIG